MSAGYCSNWTVGIPTYNRFSMLRQAVASLEHQAIKPSVIIVTDNCSSDETHKIQCRDSSIAFSYVRHESPVSAIDNFYSSLLRCETEYFSWLADDDYLYPSFSALAIGTLRANRNAVAAVGYAFESEDLLRVRFRQPRVWGPPAFEMDFNNLAPFHMPRHALLPWLTYFLPGFSPVAVFRARQLRDAISAIPRLEGYSVLLFEQYAMAKLCTYGDVAYLPAVLGVLRVHGNRATNLYTACGEAEVMQAMLGFYSFLDDCMPANLEGVEGFFAQCINDFTPPEVSHFYAVLHSRKHRLSMLVINWIFKHYRDADQLDLPKDSLPSNPQSASCFSMLRSVSKELLPPIITKLLRRARARLAQHPHP
jgi:glycosyltransferase involved in cell wall biosynthesis